MSIFQSTHHRLFHSRSRCPRSVSPDRII